MQASKTIGLRYAGIDIMCDDISEYRDDYFLLEANSAPGFAGFLMAGERSNIIVRNVVERLLDAMDSDV